MTAQCNSVLGLLVSAYTARAYISLAKCMSYMKYGKLIF